MIKFAQCQKKVLEFISDIENATNKDAGAFNLSNQVSDFPKPVECTAVIQNFTSLTAKLYGTVLLLISKKEVILTIFTGKHVNFLENNDLRELFHKYC